MELFTEVAFGIFLTELGVSSDEDAMVERTADSLCGALSRTVLRLTQAAAEFGAEECQCHNVFGGKSWVEMAGVKKELLKLRCGRSFFCFLWIYCKWMIL